MSRHLVQRRHTLEDARARFEAGSSVPEAELTADVAESWRRCAPSVSPDRDVAPVDESDVAARWEASPLRRAAPEIIEELGQTAVAEDFVAAVTDDAGRILWSAGGPSMSRLAERAHFVVGAGWDERVAGTNAPGLALVSGRPASVFSVEHWCAAVSDWVCYAAPVHGPDGAVLGVLDLSSTWRRATPLAMTTVTSMGRVIEGQLRSGAPPAAAGVELELVALGRGELRLGGAPIAVPLRQLEILVVLAVRGDATLDELHACLYGDRPVSMATLKAEISHLRRSVGGRIASRPYRLTTPCGADFLTVLDRIDRGDVAGAVAAYRGQLLPASEAPLVVDLRNQVDVALRDALLRWGDVPDLLHFADVHPFDLEVLERTAAIASPSDRHQPSLAARLARASDESGD